MWFGFSYLNHELSHVALKVAMALEAKGYSSLPVPPSHTLVQYRFYEKFDQWSGIFPINTRRLPPAWGPSAGAICS
jgi:hypothetical protein